MKVIGIGLNKTGTKTLGTCLRYWGLKHLSFSKEAFELWRVGDFTNLLQWVDRYDSFEDFPWSLIYKEIDKEYPGAKYILTTRKDAKTWFASLCRHARRTGPTIIRKCVYGHEMPDQYMDEHIRVYEEHIKSVKEYFKNRPEDLLEVCWEEGDQWDELAHFLDVECPAIPFPWRNKSRL